MEEKERDQRLSDSEIAEMQKVVQEYQEEKQKKEQTKKKTMVISIVAVILAGLLFFGIGLYDNIMNAMKYYKNDGGKWYKAVYSYMDLFEDDDLLSSDINDKLAGKFIGFSDAQIIGILFEDPVTEILYTAPSSGDLFIDILPLRDLLDFNNEYDYYAVVKTGFEGGICLFELNSASDLGEAFYEQEIDIYGELEDYHVFTDYEELGYLPVLTKTVVEEASPY